MFICFVILNLPTVLLMFFNKLASCPVPNINLHLSFYCGLPSFGFKQFIIDDALKKELALTNFANRLGPLVIIHY